MTSTEIATLFILKKPLTRYRSFYAHIYLYDLIRFWIIRFAFFAFRLKHTAQLQRICRSLFRVRHKEIIMKLARSNWKRRHRAESDSNLYKPEGIWGCTVLSEKLGTIHEFLGHTSFAITRRGQNYLKLWQVISSTRSTLSAGGFTPNDEQLDGNTANENLPYK